MSEKGFLENGFIIDLSNAKSSADIILELSDILDLPDAKGKNICLKLNDIDLNKSQVMSINSLISSMGSTLAFVSTNSTTTKDSAESLNIKISELKNEIEVQELEEATPEADKYEEENPYSTQSYETLDFEDFEEEEEENEIEELNEAETLLENLGELDEITVAVSDEKVMTETVSYPSYSEEDDDETENTEEETIQESDNTENEDTSKLPTLYLRQNLRSGQTMSYEGNVLLIGDTNPGSEIIARGDITVWGVLGGIAHAGARGNETATIRALKLNAIQLRISGCYARRPDTDNIPYIQRSNQFIPEEAMIENNEIIIHKINEID